MSSGKESSNGGRESIFLTPADSRSPPSLDPSLLEKVLEKTLDVGESAEALDGATRTALLDFARHGHHVPSAHPPLGTSGQYSVPAKRLVDGGAELSEALLAGLVQIVLRHEMALLAGQPAWNIIPEQVAHSIWDDPVARTRIAGLWRRLQGQTP